MEDYCIKYTSNGYEPQNCYCNKCRLERIENKVNAIYKLLIERQNNG